VQTTGQHTTVMLGEAVDALLTSPNGHYIDATFGRGGHSGLLLSRLSGTGRLTALDKDPEAIAQAQTIQDPRFEIIHQGFAQLALASATKVDGVLLDIGVSSPQIDDAERGFSFRRDGPLDMRMDTTRGQSAAQWLAAASADVMAKVIRDYGEERFAQPIAKAIVAHREQHGPLARTLELAKLVASVVKTREQGQDPATRTFQALRIFINAELDELEQALQASLDVLKPGGRLVVISFHSLEDRIVKQFIAKNSREEVDRRSPAWMLQTTPQMKLLAVSRSKPSAAEVAANPRARSATMRVAQRTEVLV
jgi:16S rRNA (cytosine1402-N4)-methyltransferase